MRKNFYETANLAAKIIFFCAVASGFIFTAFRAATKKDYAEYEEARCEALAVSAAMAASKAVAEEPALAALVARDGKRVFCADHMKTPGNNVVSVAIEASGDCFFVKASAQSGWNARVAKSASFETRVGAAGDFIYGDETAEEKARKVSAAAQSASRGAALEAVFASPREKPRPVTFTAFIAETDALYKKPVFIFLRR